MPGYPTTTLIIVLFFSLGVFHSFVHLLIIIDTLKLLKKITSTKKETIFEKHILIIFIYLCVCITVHIRRSWEKLQSWFSPPSWVSGVKLRLPGLVTSTFTRWTFSLAQRRPSCLQPCPRKVPRISQPLSNHYRNFRKIFLFYWSWKM